MLRFLRFLILLFTGATYWYAAADVLATHPEVSHTFILVSVVCFCCVGIALAKWKDGPESKPETRSDAPLTKQYHEDVVAWADGKLAWEDFWSKWNGRVPASPYPPRRRRESATAKNPDPLRVELTEHPKPLYREGQYVRMLGTIWRVTRSVKCYGPKDSKWWGYYVERHGDQRLPFENDLTLASPKMDEWWESAPCAKHPESYPARKMSVDITENHLEAIWVSCGCLVPVNFGKGWLKQDSHFNYVPEWVKKQEEEIAALRFKPGQWIRLQGCQTLTGKLAQLEKALKVGSVWIWHYQYEGGGWGESVEDFMEAALPRKGEWWQKERCSSRHNAVDWMYGYVRWAYTSGEYGISRDRCDRLFAAEREAVRCGCLRPVNFGKGFPHLTAIPTLFLPKLVNDHRVVSGIGEYLSPPDANGQLGALVNEDYRMPPEV